MYADKFVQILYTFVYLEYFEILEEKVELPFF